MNSISETWLAIGHTLRRDNSHIFGSAHVDAGQDIGIKAAAELKGTITGVSLQVVNVNDIAPCTGQKGCQFPRGAGNF